MTELDTVERADDSVVPVSDAADVRRVTAQPGYSIIKRNGGTVPFDPSKIAVALTRVFLAVEGNKAAASRRVHEIVESLTADVFAALTRRAKGGRVFHIEDVGDQVELALMRGAHQKVARAYVLYRDEHARARAATSRSRPPRRPDNDACQWHARRWTRPIWPP